MVTFRINVVRSALPKNPRGSSLFEMWLRLGKGNWGCLFLHIIVPIGIGQQAVYFSLGCLFDLCCHFSKGAGPDCFSGALHAFSIADEGLIAP